MKTCYRYAGFRFPAKKNGQHPSIMFFFAFLDLVTAVVVIATNGRGGRERARSGVYFICHTLESKLHLLATTFGRTTNLERKTPPGGGGVVLKIESLFQVYKAFVPIERQAQPLLLPKHRTRIPRRWAGRGEEDRGRMILSSSTNLARSPSWVVFFVL